jgi:MoxR-like ATPase
MPGPIFHNLILADDQSDAPENAGRDASRDAERCVTVGGSTHPLPDPFQVFATQNPIEQEGTYPLPEAQLDRFLLDIHVDYPSEAEEREIARRTTSGRAKKLEPVLVAAELRSFTELVPRIPITDEAIELSVRLSRLSRPASADAEIRRYVRSAPGPRGRLLLSAKARAASRR